MVEHMVESPERKLKVGDICVVTQSNYGNTGMLVKIIDANFNNIFEGGVWNVDGQIHDVVVECCIPYEVLMYGSMDTDFLGETFSRHVLPYKSVNLQRIG